MPLPLVMEKLIIKKKKWVDRMAIRGDEEAIEIKVAAAVVVVVTVVYLGPRYLQ